MHTNRKPSAPSPSPEQVIRVHRRPQPERFSANEEPALEELLSDPMTWTLMASDGLPSDALMAEIASARARLAND